MNCNSIVRKLGTFIIGSLLAGILLSCQSEVRTPSAFEAESHQSVVRSSSAIEAESTPPPRLALAPGDVVEVKFFYTEQLNETQTVRPDGKIALQLVGEVDVQDKTPAELREELQELYTPHLRNMDIAVIVRSFRDRRVFVGGQVKTPGIFEMPGKLTALEAIMQAGGFDMREAAVRNVVVIRHNGGQRYGYSLDLEPALKGDRTHAFFLQPQDIVYVPRTKIARLDQWIDQHINKLIPQTGFLFMTTSDRTTIGYRTD